MADPRTDAPSGGDSNKFYGEEIGIVENTAGPPPGMKYCVQVRVYGVFTDKTPVKDLPWAEIKLPTGCRPNDGHARPLKKGDLVWVDFPYDGDTRRPRITGSKHYCPDGKPNLPHEAWAGPDSYQHKRTAEEPEPSEHAYYEDEISTQHGVTIERNKDGSYAIYQRESGTEVTITKDGHLIFHVEGNIYRSTTEGNSVALIDGNETEHIIKHQATTANEGSNHDGGNTGDVKGNVNGHCLCTYTRKPHPMISSNVKSSL